jgi:fibro-slime domain-containing protein
MKYATTAAGVLFTCGLSVGACASHNQTLTQGIDPSSGSGSGAPDDAGATVNPATGEGLTSDAQTGVFVSDATPSSGSGDGSAPGMSNMLSAVVRDFRFYDATDSTTNPDFENPPTTGSSWDDTSIVTATLGPDGKPVYASASTTLTTHGKASFDQWYNDVDGTNVHVDYPIPLKKQSDGSLGYDSETDGVPYNIAGMTGDGFFPIDDGSPYATPFGNQGKPHNYSFTVEIHTVFTYAGGEYFNFRGDDDVFVYIDGKLVINLGGIHGPESQQVNLDSLGLQAGGMYTLDFFSAERHVTGSNIKFETTLNLQPPPPK